VPRRKRATLREVAEATNLSVAAVSYALRGMNTSAETQERVRLAADELGYRVDPVARALASGRSGLVGLLSGSLEDLGEQRFAEAVGRRLGQHDLQILVTDARGEPGRERDLARQLADTWVDGLIVSPLDPSADFWTEIAASLPLVTVGDALPGRTVGELLYDNRQGVTQVLEHLHGLGHRRVVVLTPNRRTTPDRPAEVVVREVADRLALEVAVESAPHSIEGASTLAQRVLAGPQPPTAVFGLSDSIACGAYAAARALGLAIPGDLSVAGYDDHPIARVLTPELTSVAWDVAGVARSAADLVAAAVVGEAQHRRVRVEPRLVARDSTGPARVDP
jgi:LacI family transcriptional regulator